MEINKDLERETLLSPLLSKFNENELQILLLLTSDTIGNDNPSLGKKLMHSFLYSLTEMPPRIHHIILINGAVQLVMKGSKAIESLSVLNDAKVGIIVCEESMHHYGNLSLLEIGRPVSMYTITNMLLTAERVITL